ncbi:hypothetical protein TNCV_3618971 [Trichonephila clavipes]|nr:hypothetical protein TNCV_3618971 [Trichonephila clavipes]
MVVYQYQIVLSSVGGKVTAYHVFGLDGIHKDLVLKAPDSQEFVLDMPGRQNPSHKKVEGYTRAYENVYTDSDCRSGSGNEKHVRGMLSKVNAAYEGRGLKSTQHNQRYGLVKPKTTFLNQVFEME